MEVWVVSCESFVEGVVAEWPDEDDDGAIAKDGAVLVSVGSRILEVGGGVRCCSIDWHWLRAGSGGMGRTAALPFPVVRRHPPFIIHSSLSFVVSVPIVVTNTSCTGGGEGGPGARRRRGLPRRRGLARGARRRGRGAAAERRRGARARAHALPQRQVLHESGAPRAPGRQSAALAAGRRPQTGQRRAQARGGSRRCQVRELAPKA